MPKPAAGLLLACLLAGCAQPRVPARRTAPAGSLVAGGAMAPSAKAGISVPKHGWKVSGFEPLDLPLGRDMPALGQPAASQVAKEAQAADSPAPQDAAASSSSLPPESAGKPPADAGPAGGGAAAAAQPKPPASSAVPIDRTAAAEPPAGEAAPAADQADPGADAPGAAPVQDASLMPLMSDLNKDQIGKLLDNRLDIGGYRVQISATDDFSGGKVLFDKTYDAMENINLFDEFKAAGVNIDKSAYWVRIAFIDLLQIELPWTKPRLYGLNKQRLEQ